LEGTHFGLFPVQVELVLGNGALPDAFGQGLSLAKPDINMNVAWNFRNRITKLCNKMSIV
jgi:hypothetical protein